MTTIGDWNKLLRPKGLSTAERDGHNSGSEQSSLSRRSFTSRKGRLQLSGPIFFSVRRAHQRPAGTTTIREANNLLHPQGLLCNKCAGNDGSTSQGTFSVPEKCFLSFPALLIQIQLYFRLTVAGIYFRICL